MCLISLFSKFIDRFALCVHFRLFGVPADIVTSMCTHANVSDVSVVVYAQRGSIAGYAISSHVIWSACTEYSASMLTEGATSRSTSLPNIQRYLIVTQ